MDNIDVTLENLRPLFQQTYEALCDLKDGDIINVPTLVTIMAGKYSWSEKRIREVDPLIRHYIRNHPEYVVERGAKGGIKRMVDKAARNAKLLAKQQIKNTIANKIAASLSPPTVVDSDNTTMQVDSENDVLDDILDNFSASFDKEAVL